MTHYGMAIDLSRCIGCHTCAIACKMANNLPKNVLFNRVRTVGGDGMDTASGEYGANTMSFLPVQCQHCEKPACLEVCPTGATTGCESCIKACPYEGVRTLIKSPEYYLDVVVGEYDAPPHKGGTVEKCTFCKNLIDRGDVPACMQLCPGRARYWGDLDDPESDVSKAIEGRETMFLNEEAGTKPSVYYLQ